LEWLGIVDAHPTIYRLLKADSEAMMEEINGVRNLLAKKDIIRNLAYLFFATFV
jgi:hypothetical protein